MPAPGKGVSGDNPTRWTKRVMRVVPLKWLALLAAGNQLLEKSGGRQSSEYPQSSERWHALRKCQLHMGWEKRLH